MQSLQEEGREIGDGSCWREKGMREGIWGLQEKWSRRLQICIKSTVRRSVFDLQPLLLHHLSRRIFANVDSLFASLLIMTPIDMDAISFYQRPPSNANASKSKRSATTGCEIHDTSGRSANRPLPRRRNVRGGTLDDHEVIEILDLTGPSRKEPLCLPELPKTDGIAYGEKVNGENSRFARLTMANNLNSSRWTPCK